MDKRIPRNPKYENVESTIDTGFIMIRSKTNIYPVLFSGDSLTKFLKRNEELRACKLLLLLLFVRYCILKIKKYRSNSLCQILSI